MMSFNAIQAGINKYSAVATLGELRNICMNPRRVDLSTEAERAKDPALARAYEQRDENQRHFDKARTLRAISYAAYIRAVDSGERMGDYPPITLWTEQSLSLVDGKLQLPGQTMLTANDGETQLAARYMLADGFFDKKIGVEVQGDVSLLDTPFLITVTTNSSKLAAMQTLHDMNHYATPVSEKTTATMNIEGALTKAIHEGIVLSGHGDALIKSRGADVKPSENYNTTRLALLHGALGACYGELVFEKSTNSLIDRGNRQFADLNGEGFVVTNFINKVLQISPKILRHIGCDHMMALGAKYHKHAEIKTPLTPEQVSAIVAEIKAERTRRAPLNVSAKVIYDRLS